MSYLEGDTFAELLHRLRKRARLTQQALAERMGAHRNTVGLWERGEYLPETLTSVLELARVLQLSEADQRLLVEHHIAVMLRHVPSAAIAPHDIPVFPAA